MRHETVWIFNYAIPKSMGGALASRGLEPVYVNERAPVEDLYVIARPDIVVTNTAENVEGIRALEYRRSRKSRKIMIGTSADDTLSTGEGFDGYVPSGDVTDIDKLIQGLHAPRRAA